MNVKFAGDHRPPDRNSLHSAVGMFTEEELAEKSRTYRAIRPPPSHVLAGNGQAVGELTDLTGSSGLEQLLVR